MHNNRLLWEGKMKIYLEDYIIKKVNQILYDLADENERKDYELSFVSCCTDEMLKKLKSRAALKGKKVFQTEITTHPWVQMFSQRFLLFVIDIALVSISKMFGFLPIIGSLISSAIGLLLLVLIIVSMVNAFQGFARELPGIGHIRLIK